ncbi:WD repeat-containing protein 81-like isoform X2 [Clavelina lepadiformis]|uniref:WD repeat-containing protein 81-like isoform X2 n=1 Tax=Clavelina lepadiformis TaxID=159417 RepID=UPI004042DDD5
MHNTYFYTKALTFYPQYKSFGLIYQLLAEEDFRHGQEELLEKYKAYFNSRIGFRSPLVSESDLDLDSFEKDTLPNALFCKDVFKLNSTFSFSQVDENNEPELVGKSTLHSNCLTQFMIHENSKNVHFFNIEEIYTVSDALMYSPYVFNKTSSCPMFVLFQLLKTYSFFYDTFPLLDMTSVSWENMSIDNRLWIKLDILENLRMFSDGLQNYQDEHRKNKFNFDGCSLGINSIQEILKSWITNRISNYDYVMFLNHIAGKKLNDPHCHPMIPWVSDLSVWNGGWRELDKSKYRLNKGENQLSVQYAMVSSQTPSKLDVDIPYHIPDMLSDITYYVYKARHIEKGILQKHVRAYWEPNEYPASIQRIHDWTPDECIPEFYMDSSVFFSIHGDMNHLNTPSWSTSPEDFIAKHMSMLEHSEVSEYLHDWIDINFGYKLSGKDAVRAMNVCRHLVDQHNELVKNGIVQLFNIPHPRKHQLQNISKYPELTNDDQQNVQQIFPASNLKIGLTRPTSLCGEDLHLENLEDLEKLLRFNFVKPYGSSETHSQLNLFPEKKNWSQCNVTQMIADRNLISFVCLTVELFCSVEIQHSKFPLSLADRLSRAVCCLKSAATTIPQTIQTVLDNILNALSESVERTVLHLQELDCMISDGSFYKDSMRRLFKSSDEHFSPTVSLLTTECFRFLHFPDFFETFYTFITDFMEFKEISNSQLFAEEECLYMIETSLVDLLAQIQENCDGINMLLPYLTSFLQQSVVVSSRALVLFFDHVSEALENTREKAMEFILQSLIFALNRYGTLLLTHQYIPHISHSISSAISGISITNTSISVLEASTTLLIHFTSYLKKHQIMEHFDTLSKGIIMPLVGILGSRNVSFLGSKRRKTLCLKVISLLFSITVRIGRDMAQTYLSPIYVSFFSLFSQHSVMWNEDGTSFDKTHTKADIQCLLGGETEESVTFHVREELQEAFCPETAYQAYIHITRFIGEHSMEKILKEHYEVVRKFCTLSKQVTGGNVHQLKSDKIITSVSSTNATIVGNCITMNDFGTAINLKETDELNLKDFVFADMSDDWQAYWEHEVTLSSSNDHFRFKHFNLQQFYGHSAAVRNIFVPDSEQWFMSSSKDKTVKLWSLCDVTKQELQPLFVYDSHKKPLIYTTLVEAYSKVASCDGTLHIWDPFTGQQESKYGSTELKANVTAMEASSSMPHIVLTATIDSMLKVIDIRSDCVAQEYKPTVGPSSGTIRCLCSNNSWAAVGFTSGLISLVDLRMGLMLQMWQGHESDVVASHSITGSSFVTSSADQTLMYWNNQSTVPLLIYNAVPDVVHTVMSYNSEMISGSSSGRISVHSLPAEGFCGDMNKDWNNSTIVTKLHNDALKGSLSAFATLPMKHQILLSSDTGCLKLFA